MMCWPLSLTHTVDPQPELAYAIGLGQAALAPVPEAAAAILAALPPQPMHLTGWRPVNGVVAYAGFLKLAYNKINPLTREDGLWRSR